MPVISIHPNGSNKIISVGVEQENLDDEGDDDDDKEEEEEEAEGDRS